MPPGDYLLAWAFVISLSTHLLLFACFLVGHRLGWWQKELLPVWLRPALQAVAELQKPRQATPVLPHDMPLVFVEVDPAQATPEPPKDAPYYSTHNSLAANPDARTETGKPKIDGTQLHVPKTETTERSKAFPLQPAAPKPAESPGAAAQSRPKGGQQAGDLALAKPTDKLVTKPLDQPAVGDALTAVGEAPVTVHKRPRTLAQAQSQSSALAGQKMKQDGGVKRNRLTPSFDARATPFGAYDAALIAAVQSRWYDLIERGDVSRERTGRVMVRFRLHEDGRISRVEVVENGVDDILSYMCQRAITDPSPYEKWPSDMRRIIGADYREVIFTFYYE